jgi:hypothetical protein
MTAEWPQVPLAEVLRQSRDYDDRGQLISVNLDIKNPNAAGTLEHLPPEQVVAGILEKERRIIEIVEEIKAELEGGRA